MPPPAPAFSGVEALVRRDRLIVAAGLAILAALSWAWLLRGAGTGMNVWGMTRPAFFPGERSVAAAAGPWSVATWLVATSMWWVMMIAMMIPGAAPMILLHARVTRHAQARGQVAAGPVPSAAFLGGYLLVWLGFSVAAATLQWAAERSGLLSQPTMWSVNAWLTAALFVAAGLYQISALKHVCLARCRAPADFLSRHWRAGRRGALRMGVDHGAYCVGCCWSLMALLFAGGIMNVYWIAGLASVVLIEKSAPRGDLLAFATAPLFVAVGVWIAWRAV